MRTVYGFIVLVFGLCLVENRSYLIRDTISNVTESDSNATNPEQTNKLEPNLTNVAQKPRRSRRYLIFSRSIVSNGSIEECVKSAEDFPQLFSEKQLQRVAFIPAIFIAIYCFTILAVICENYFLPCVEKICEALNLSQDVAAATFMSVATSAPELFVNLIGTFITESDIGIGTVVGSSLFNSLGVASLGGLAASTPIQLHWWPLTRDVIIYILAISLLVMITWNGVIHWYEGLILFIVYFLYFTVMFQNVRLSKFAKKLIKRKNKITTDCAKSPNKRPSISVISHYGSYMEEPIKSYSDIKDLKDIKELETVTVKNEEMTSPFSIPEGSIWKKMFFFYVWPIKFILFCTVPDPMQYPKLFPLTFVMCIFWIGSNSYMVSWMISVIGTTFKIPDAVLGLTFLAAGGCLPEAISITIMSRRGEGSMGVSNSLGANTMNILLSLGMPWFLKTILMGTDDSAKIEIDSSSLVYTISALVLVAIILYFTLYFNKFRLGRKVGVILLCVYTVCIVLAILSEMVFFKSSECGRNNHHHVS